MPPALTLLFKLIFPCMETQVQENNKVKYINLMQNPPFFNKISRKPIRLNVSHGLPSVEFATLK